MSDGRKQILSSFSGRKKQQTWNNITEKLNFDKNLAETDRGSYYNKEKWLEEFLDGKTWFQPVRLTYT